MNYQIGSRDVHMKVFSLATHGVQPHDSISPIILSILGESRTIEIKKEAAKKSIKAL